MSKLYNQLFLILFFSTQFLRINADYPNHIVKNKEANNPEILSECFLKGFETRSGTSATLFYDLTLTGSLFVNGGIIVDGGLTLNGGSIPGIPATELIVTTGEISGPGMFSSINNAMNSITDASPSKPYIIKVGPGTFVESTIHMQPYVHLVGLSQYASIITASNPTQNLIIGASNASVESCMLQGATSAGATAIYYDQPDVFRVIGCRFGQNNTLIKQGGTSTLPGSATLVSFCSANRDSNFTTAFSIKNTQLLPSGILINDFIWQPLTSQPQLNAFADISGNCVLLAAEVLAGAPLPLDFTIGGTGFKVYDGATLRLNDCSACGFGTALHVPNRGNGASLHVTDLLCENNTMDVLVSTTAVTGILSGQFSNTLTSITPNTPLSLLIQDYKNSKLTSNNTIEGAALHTTGAVTFNTSGTNTLNSIGSISSLNNQCILFGSVNTSTGAIVSGSGFSYSKIGTGTGTVTFSNSFSAPPIITLAATSNVLASLSSTSSSSFSLSVVNSLSYATNSTISFIAIGTVA